MNFRRKNEHDAFSFGMEVVFIWGLLVLRVFGSIIFVNGYFVFFPSEYANASIEYGEVFLDLLKYAFYAPIDGMLSIVCIWLLIRKALGFSFKRGKESLKHGFLILLPLVIASAFSLLWLFTLYPAWVNIQYKYIHNQNRALGHMTALYRKCEYRILTGKNMLCFDGWDEMARFWCFEPVVFRKKESPSKMFCAGISMEDGSQHAGRALLNVAHLESGQQIEIGRSIRGIEVTWKETQLGDLLLVENHIDTHHREAFVLFPQLDKKGMLTCSVLYATPDQNICESRPEGTPAEHIYPTITDVSYDGIMTIEIMWTYFIPEDAGKTITTKIPLFYGWQKNLRGL
jgi:hypothetical protein